MSIIGTSIAAGVAQAAQQAQEVSRRREKRVSDQQRQVREIEEKLDLQRVAVEEDDRVETSMEMRIDAQLPEHHPPEHQARLESEAHAIRKEQSEEKPSSMTDGDGAGEIGGGGGESDDHGGDGLYHHLDVTG